MDGRRIPGRLGRSEKGEGTRPAIKQMVSTAGRSRGASAFRKTLTEDQLHRSIAELLDWILIPPAVWTTFPAGWGKLPIATAGRLKACGLKDGIPDILLWYEGASFGVELKRPGKGLSGPQKAMRPKLEAAGVKVATCSSPEEVVEALRRWEFPLRRFVIDGRPTVALADPVAEARLEAQPAQSATQADG